MDGADTETQEGSGVGAHQELGEEVVASDDLFARLLEAQETQRLGREKFLAIKGEINHLGELMEERLPVIEDGSYSTEREGIVVDSKGKRVQIYTNRIRYTNYPNHPDSLLTGVSLFDPEGRVGMHLGMFSNGKDPNINDYIRLFSGPLRDDETASVELRHRGREYDVAVEGESSEVGDLLGVAEKGVRDVISRAGEFKLDVGSPEDTSPAQTEGIQ